MLAEIDPVPRAAGQPFAYIKFGKGLYYYANWTAGVVSTATYAIARAILTPVFFPHQITISEVGVWCTAGAANSTITFGIYSDLYGKPDILQYGSTGIASTASGAIFVTITPTITLPPGLYWFGQFNTGGTPTTSSYSVSGNGYEWIGTGRPGSASSTNGLFKDSVTAWETRATGYGPISTNGQIWFKTA